MINKFISDRFIKHIYPLINSIAKEENKKFPSHYKLVPHIHSKTIGWTHYGVMIPDLPAPHHFYSVMSIIGTPGALAFDNDHMLKDSPRNNTTVVFGTDADGANEFKSYSIPKECDFLDDGSKIQFGNDLIITGTYPHYTLHSENSNYSIDLSLTVTDKVSWFVKTPVYEHISLLAQYRGTLTYKGEQQNIEGLCTFEHAAAFSPHLIWNKTLSKNTKLPVDFFTYQIINLDAETQMLLTETRVNGSKIISKAFIRSLSTYNQSYEAQFEVVKYQEDLAISPNGESMRLPEIFAWKIYDANDHEILYLKANVSTDFHYGLGSGYVGGYVYEGTYKGNTIQGQGYIEYIDRT